MYVDDRISDRTNFIYLPRYISAYKLMISMNGYFAHARYIYTTKTLIQDTMRKSLTIGRLIT